MSRGCGDGFDGPPRASVPGGLEVRDERLFHFAQRRQGLRRGARHGELAAVQRRVQGGLARRPLQQDARRAAAVRGGHEGWPGGRERRRGSRARREGNHRRAWCRGMHGELLQRRIGHPRGGAGVQRRLSQRGLRQRGLRQCTEARRGRRRRRLQGGGLRPGLPLPLYRSGRELGLVDEDLVRPPHLLHLPLGHLELLLQSVDGLGVAEVLVDHGRDAEAQLEARGFGLPLRHVHPLLLRPGPWLLGAVLVQEEGRFALVWRGIAIAVRAQLRELGLQILYLLLLLAHHLLCLSELLLGGGQLLERPLLLGPLHGRLLPHGLRVCLRPLGPGNRLGEEVSRSV
mmetsp:Transcript_79170/g.214383  ORF Transcript_79170/g.214383 Transcript_79170/m.214383 type:complete len:343 (-) Transcript_79170:1025-2053(-)